MITYNISVNPAKERCIYSDIEFTCGDIRAYRLAFNFSGLDFSGKTLLIKALRADDSVAICSSQTDEIILPAAVYAVPGELSLEVCLCTAGGSCVTVCVITASVRESFGEGEIATGDRYTLLQEILTRLTAVEEQVLAMGE